MSAGAPLQRLVAAGRVHAARTRIADGGAAAHERDPVRAALAPPLLVALVCGIVETITGIAGQTNLLAPNAAIEAAPGGRRRRRGRGAHVGDEQMREVFLRIGGSVADVSGRVEQIAAATQQVAAEARRCRRA